MPAAAVVSSKPAVRAPAAGDGAGVAAGAAGFVGWSSPHDDRTGAAASAKTTAAAASARRGFGGVRARGEVRASIDDSGRGALRDGIPASSCAVERPGRPANVV